MEKQLRVWNRRRPINYPKQIEMAGGIAAPLLVGFSLTTVTQLVTGRDDPWLSEWAVALFAIAAAAIDYMYLRPGARLYGRLSALGLQRWQHERGADLKGHNHAGRVC